MEDGGLGGIDTSVPFTPNFGGWGRYLGLYQCSLHSLQILVDWAGVDISVPFTPNSGGAAPSSPSGIDAHDYLNAATQQNS